ncbi:MAG: hypothetical protein ACOC2H_07200 [Spirochaetota bacterium]
MFDNITVQAGKKAYDMIQDGGFNPSLIKTIPAASGGPKFLVVTGLDKAILSNWLSATSHTINWIGSSIGSWRGSAIAQSDPIRALELLEDAYIHQQYSAKPDAQEVTNVAWGVMNAFIHEDEIRYILSSSRYRLHLFTARSKGLGKSDLPLLIGMHLFGAMTGNLLHRQLTALFFSRFIFTPPGDLPSCVTQLKDFFTRQKELTESNFRNVLMASGSIPFAMRRIEMEDGTILRDGGLIDYHFDIPFSCEEGITLYPHYSSRICPGWFDKHIPWRHAKRTNYDNTILVSPSDSFIRGLPNSKVPDRKDFALYKGRDRDRFTDWARVVKQSRILGEELVEAFASGKIKKIMTRL